jgi:Na+/proline symporter
MTGLDQDMMQKNLTCKNIKEAQKNMYWFSTSLIFANLLFLTLGVLLFTYAEVNAIVVPERSDDLFPFLALNHFPPFAGIIFLLGITAAAYSSADSALTSLTTSFCVDFLGFKPGGEERRSVRFKVHLAFSVILFVAIMIFQLINDESVISSLFTAAGYTYGPLLGLFSFGLFSKRIVLDRWVPIVCFLSPILAFILKLKAPDWFWGYQIGFEILIFNGIFTFIGLLILSRKSNMLQSHT